MAKILVYADLNKGRPKGVALQILSNLTGHQVEACVIGELNAEGQEDLKKNGVSKIHCVAHTGNYSPEFNGNSLATLVKSGGYDYVLTGGSAATKDFFPRAAAILGNTLVADATSIKFEGNELKVIKPIFAGKCLAQLKLEGPKPHFVSIRPNALELKTGVSAGAGEKVVVSGDTSQLRAVIKEIVKSASEKIDLTEANIIISGGRGMKNGENYKILYECANVIGAAVGASRAAVDSGFVPYEMQVGQTGKTVSPQLYIACGISGAIQHLAGMRTSKIIMAINIDPNAPIFSKADYGIVGDLFQVVPILTEELKKVMEH